MATKLCQIIAIEKGVKNKSNVELTQAYHAIQKPALFAGIARQYRPKDEEGEKLPSENGKVQVQAEDMLKRAAEISTTLYDIVSTKDKANQKATADVLLDGSPILTGVPVSTLLFLEKQLIDLATVVKSIPTLDAAEDWKFDPTVNAYASSPSETTRTKKIPRNHVKAEATDKHPAQVETFMEDVIVGTWKTVKFSGALPAVRVQVLLDRISKLQTAVKYAREEANSIEVSEVRIGSQLFNYLLSA